MDSAIYQSGEDVIIKAKVKTNSPRFLIHLKEDRVMIEVSGPPEKGKANQEIIRNLRKLFRRNVEIARGSLSRQKTIIIRNIRVSEVREAITR